MHQSRSSFRMSRVGTLIIAGASFFVTGTSAQARIGCYELSQLQTMSKDRFAEIKGAYDSDLNEYSTTFIVGGADECTLTDLDFGSPGYSCSWEKASNVAMDGLFDEVLENVRSCVIDEVKEIEANRDNVRSLTHSIIIPFGRLKPTITISKSTRRATPRHPIKYSVAIRFVASNYEP